MIVDFHYLFDKIHWVWSDEKFSVFPVATQSTKRTVELLPVVHDLLPDLRVQHPRHVVIHSPAGVGELGGTQIAGPICGRCS